MRHLEHELVDRQRGEREVAPGLRDAARTDHDDARMPVLQAKFGNGGVLSSYSVDGREQGLHPVLAHVRVVDRHLRELELSAD